MFQISSLAKNLLIPIFNYLLIAGRNIPIGKSLLSFLRSASAVAFVNVYIFGHFKEFISFSDKVHANVITSLGLIEYVQKFSPICFSGKFEYTVDT